MRARTDSSVVLSWLITDQKLFKIFFTNRVVKIHSLFLYFNWSHVLTTENPVDLSSSGLFPDDLVARSLHWKGPPFINFPEVCWSRPLVQAFNSHHLPDVKTTSTYVLVVHEKLNFDNLLLRFSWWSYFQRALAYALCFVDHVLLKRPTYTDVLTPDEEQRLMRLDIRVTQRTHFHIFQNSYNNWLNPIKQWPHRLWFSWLLLWIILV